MERVKKGENKLTQFLNLPQRRKIWMCLNKHCRKSQRPLKHWKAIQKPVDSVITAEKIFLGYTFVLFRMILVEIIQNN